MQVVRMGELGTSTGQHRVGLWRCTRQPIARNGKAICLPGQDDAPKARCVLFDQGVLLT